MPHKDRVQRLQIELGSEIHYGKILIIEVPVLSGGVAVATNQVRKHLSVRPEMPIEVHQHEAGELQKARVDLSPAAARRPRHLGYGDAPEPLEPPLLRQLVH